MSSDKFLCIHVGLFREKEVLILIDILKDKHNIIATVQQISGGDGSLGFFIKISNCSLRQVKYLVRNILPTRMLYDFKLMGDVFNKPTDLDFWINVNK